MSSLNTIGIRVANEADLPAIRAIYNHYVDTSTATFQLEHDTEAERLAWFQKRSDKHPAIVAESAGEVLGWAALSPWKERAGYAHSVEASVYIREDQQRRGIGKALLLDLLERARRIGHHVVIGGLHGASGKHCIATFGGLRARRHFRETGYKFGRWLDVEYLQVILKPL